MICDHHVFRSTSHSECMIEDPLSLVLRAGQTQFGNSSGKKKVRTSASCDAVGLFTPLYHYRFMISLRVIQNDYGFLLAPKLHLPSNH